MAFSALGCNERLVAAIQELSLARTLEAIADVVKHAARDLSHADGATFVLREDDLCYYFDEDAIGPLWKGRKFPIETCISGWAMLQRVAVPVRDIFKDSRIPLGVYKPTFVRSLLITPIRRQAPLGAIGIYWSQTHEPSEIEKSVLQALADATSTAMENISLYSSLRAKVGELERANKAKDEFLLTISHELRTPMNSILGWSDILADRAECTDEDIEEGVQAIHRNAITQMTLITELLDASEILSGTLVLRRSLVDVKEALDTIVRPARIRAAQKGLLLKVESKCKDCHVFGDRDRLAVVFKNLIDNAIEYTPPAGLITISVSGQGASAVIRVSDTGEGIDDAFLPFVFERFSQEDGSNTRSHGGLGLGLSIVKAVVEAHGGHVTAESLGRARGTTLTVTLPLARPKARPDLELDVAAINA